MDWISVKDRMPTPYASVLTCNANDPDDIPVVLYWDNRADWWASDLCCEPNGFKVTHWMPLPSVATTPQE